MIRFSVRARLRKVLTRRVHDESGFTVIEAMIATSLAAVILLSVAYAAFSGLNAVMTTKRNQQATALGTQAVELARELEFDDLSMVTGDLTTDTRVLASCTGLTGTKFFDPDGAGPIGCEQIVHSSAGGGVNPHTTTETVAGVSYTVSRYVTCTAAMTTNFTVCPGTKRMVAVLTWSDRGRPRTLRTTTLVTRARRGLPVPKFTLTPTAQTKITSQNQQVAFLHVIRNLGIADAYRAQHDVIEVSPTTPPRLWTVTYVQDVNNDESYDPVVDNVTLTDSDADSWIEIPTVQTTESYRFFAVFTVPSSDLNGIAELRVTVKSSVDDNVNKLSRDTVIIGTSTRLFHLHNRPARVGSPPPSTDTDLERDMDMDTTAPTAVGLVRYSQNAPNSLGCRTDLGRCLERTTATDQTSPGNSANSRVQTANWVTQLPTDTTFNGTAIAQLYVARPGGACTGPVNLTVYLRNKPNATAVTTADGVTLLGSQTATVSTLGTVLPCAAVSVSVSFPLTNVTVASGRYIELKVVNNSSSVGHVMLGYDATITPATLSMPVAGA